MTDDLRKNDSMSIEIVRLRQRARGDRRRNRGPAVNDSERRDDTAPGGAADDHALQTAIGRQVRQLRRQLNLTLVELGKLTDMTPSVLSNLENGLISPTLPRLRMLASAFHIPLTLLFQKFEAHRSTSYVPAGEGILVQRRGNRGGNEYRLLGHVAGGSVTVEPYLLTLTDDSQMFAAFQHSGTAFLYILAGKMAYRHIEDVYTLQPGDSLMFDSNGPHGPEKLLDAPLRLLLVIVRATGDH